MVAQQRGQDRPRENQVGVGIRLHEFTLTLVVPRKVPQADDPLARDRSYGPNLFQSALALFPAEHLNECPSIRALAVARPSTLRRTQVPVGRNLVNAEVPVRRIPRRREEPRLNRDGILPRPPHGMQVHLFTPRSIANQLSALGDPPHAPPLALSKSFLDGIITQRQHRIRRHLFQAERARRAGEAESGRIGVAPVFGFGGLERVVACLARGEEVCVRCQCGGSRREADHDVEGVRKGGYGREGVRWPCEFGGLPEGVALGDGETGKSFAAPVGGAYKDVSACPGGRECDPPKPL